MRIIFDSAVYDLRNKGNLALLLTAIDRISRMFPDADLQVLTSAPHILRLYCPTAIPLDPDGQPVVRNWIDQLPLPILRLVLEGREEIWHRLPGLGRYLTRASWRGGLAHASAEDTVKPMNKPVASPSPEASLDFLNDCDFYVATGAQYMSDPCWKEALIVLARLQRAIQLNIPAVMVGQGIGPIKNLELRARAAQVLPLVDYIFIRDNVTVPPLLTELGVDPTRVIMTGDDAIEMVYQLRSAVPGKAIGVSLRAGPYTQIDENHLGVIRQALEQAVVKRAVNLLSIPISHSLHEQDDRVLERLIADLNHTARRWRFDSPQDIVKQVGHCRIMVTGTFHAAIFALAQGIPVVGLVKSIFYQNKFLGLVEQFGPGCQIVSLDDPAFAETLMRAIDVAWESAEQVKPELLAAAARQIEMGTAAYRKLFGLVSACRARGVAKVQV